MSALSVLDQKATAVNEVVNAFNLEVKELLIQALQEEVFSKHREQINYVGISNYTPYFNDGCPCEFTLGNIVVCLTYADEDEYNEDDEYAIPEEDKDLFDEVLETTANVFGAISEATWEAVFGNNITIHFNADGTVEVRDYEPPF